MTRKALTFVEIDVSVCSLAYGVAPCTAAIPTTGTQKCFNTYGSCQDRAHYTESFVTLRFCEDTGYQAQSGTEAIPSLTAVDVTPGKIALGEGLGQRASVSCSFREHPHSDTGEGFDPYLSTRAYDPFKQGTFWAKFAARHPNLRGKKLRVIRGYLGQALEEMETRHFIVDSIDGPGLDGKFTVIAKDPLKALDGDRAVAPAPSTGYLAADINSSTTSATLAPANVGNASYPANGFLAIGGTEIVAFTRTNDTLTLTRGQKNTTGVAHKAGDRAQLCLAYTSQDPSVIFADLATTYGGIDASYIPADDWLGETQGYSGQVYSTFIAEPTSVKKLVAELIEQTGLVVWWDEIGEKIRMQVLRQIDTAAATFDEGRYLDGSLTIKAQPEKRYSQVWTYFGQRNPLEGVDDPSNYFSVAVKVDADSERIYGSPSIKTIFSRWIPQGGRTIAERLNEVQLGRYLVPPRAIQFSVVDDDSGVRPVLGGGYRLSSRANQDVDGTRVAMPFQVTGIKPSRGALIVAAEELNFTSLQVGDPANRVITIDFTDNALNLRSLHDGLFGTPHFGGLVTFEITSAALIGSTGVNTPSIDTGTWPTVSRTGNRTSGSPVLTGLANTTNFVAGMAVRGTGIPDNARILSVDSSTQITLDKNASSGSGTATALTIYTTRILIRLAGDVRGAGGNGGLGARGSASNGSAGQQGGTALKVRAAVDVVVLASGKLRGGGGGGGGGPCQTYADHSGGGGGGGAGIPPGGGGPAQGSGGGYSEPGGSGSTTNGGPGGRSWTTSGVWGEWPELENGYRGGYGGNLGEGGNVGYPSWMPMGPGGAGPAGYAIDGISLTKLTNNGIVAGQQGN